jgi:FtsP/CotA-like multicopper oxidase with cupredoxin domain
MDKIMGYMMGDMQGMDHGSMGHMHAAVPIEWEDQMGDMNTFSTSDTTRWVVRDEETGKENMDVVWKFKQGELVKIRIVNDPNSAHPMQHPFHFHGNRFVVLSVNGVPNTNMVWKDTTLLKTGDIVDVLLETTNPGKWMAHCHIAEHLHSGMMIEYDVE